MFVSGDTQIASHLTIALHGRLIKSFQSQYCQGFAPFSAPTNVLFQSVNFDGYATSTLVNENAGALVDLRLTKIF